MNEKKSLQSKYINKSIPSKPLIEEAAEQSVSPQISLDHATGGPSELPNLSNTAAIRRQLIRRLQGQLGNAVVIRRLAYKGKPSDRVPHLVRSVFLQRNGEEELAGDGDRGSPAAAAGDAIGTATGTATGAATAETVIQNGTEAFYDVSGATLNDITGQLSHFDGRFGAQTETQLGISTEEMPIQRRPNGTLRVEGPWSINSAVVGLPRWINYDEACAAAQQEWDRFMRRARQHEQEAHVDMAYQFVRDLGPRDRVVTGRNAAALRHAAALRRNLAAKQRALISRLRTLHDGCDHGASIDALPHLDNGRCA